MATTATLNGGATGGLLTTTTAPLIHTENSQTEESCRVESTSSLEPEDALQTENLAPFDDQDSTPITKTSSTAAHNNAWSYDDKSYTDSSPSFMDALSNNYALEGNNNNKKRRKQTRPVRIPASTPEGGHIINESPTHSSSKTLETTTGETTKRAQFPLNLSNKLALAASQYNEEEEEDVDEEAEEEENNSSTLQQQQQTQQQRSALIQQRKVISSHLESGSPELDPLTGGSGNNTGPTGLPSRNVFSSMLHEYNKTEHMIGTKDATLAATYTTTMSSGSSPSSNSVPSSFSPILFPLTGSPSPFSALIPSAAGFFVQQQLQGQPVTTSSSSSSTHHQLNSSNGHGLFDPKLGPLINTSGATGSNNPPGGSSMQSVPPHRIFNPEAYCDLCNKEFCNKYFLKTHKANKHGVYTSEGTNTNSNPPSNFSSLIPPNSSCTTHPSVGGNLSANVTPASSTVSSSFLPLSGGLVTNSGTIGSALLPTDVHPKGQTVTTNSGNSMDLPLSSSLPYSSMGSSDKIGSGGSSSSGSQRDSFCELCQKEFCNKYFLKRHKSKIHGIPSESTSSNSGRSGKRHSSESKVNDPLFPFNLELSAIRNSLSGAAMNLDSLHSSAAELLAASKGSVDPQSLLLMNNNNTGDSSNVHNTADNSNASGGHLSAQELVLNTVEDDNSREHLGDDNNSKGSSTDTKRSRVGSQGALMSQKLPCQFCAREFTNHQLLTSHLLKKHKLLVPPLPQFLFPLQALPSNLFDMDAMGNNGGKGQSESHHSSGASSGENEDFDCNLCNRSFPSLQLLQLHTTHFHSESDEAKEHLSQLLLKEAAAAAMIANNNVTTDPISKLCGSETMEESRKPTAEDNKAESSELNKVDETGSGKNTPVSTAEDEDMVANEEEDDNRSVTTPGLPANNVAKGENTSDSDDLRRLQTMIMELNRVSSAGGTLSWSPPLDSSGTTGTTAVTTTTSANPSPNTGVVTSQAANVATSSSLLPAVACHICAKEFHSPFFLQQHIQQHHSRNTSSPAGANVTSSCTKNEGSLGTTTSHSFNDSAEFPNSRHHPNDTSSGLNTTMNKILAGQKEASRSNVQTKESSTSSLSRSLPPSTGQFLAPSPQQHKSSKSLESSSSSGKRPSPSLSRSYCTICHKELCNKYFMRTHMLKMHGISIESSTGLGGVTCDICKKELCSKYFLKVHKQNTHGIVEEGASPPTSTPGLSAAPSNNAVSTLLGLNLSMNSSNHNNNNGSPNRMIITDEEERDAMICNYSDLCPLCGRRCRGSKLLKTHLLQDHGQEGRERWKLMEKNSQRRQKSGGKSLPNSGGVKSGAKASKLLEDTESGGNKCAFCGFVTADVELMKIHLLSEHGKHFNGDQTTLSEVAAATWQNAARGVVLDPLTMLFQKMDSGAHKVYKCSYCPFTTSLLVYLYAHERTHTGLADSVASFPSGSPIDTQVKVESSSENLMSAESSERIGNSASSTGNNNTASHQCPMCFHTFHSTEVYQQHLLGHQMSGVLAPFFSNGRFPFVASPNSVSDQNAAAFLSLPLLNGSGGAAGTGGNTSFPWLTRQIEEAEEKGKRKAEDDEINKERRKLDSTKGIIEDDQRQGKKLRKISYFQCVHCKGKFETRLECSTHVKEEHSGLRNEMREQKRKKKKGFHCRKCKFTCTTYHALLIHGRKEHGHHRPVGYSREGIHKFPGGPDQVTDEEFIMQAFLLTSSEEEEKSDQSGHFVPSLVYLPVREKVSQSIRVSFSLTPKS